MTTYTREETNEAIEEILRGFETKTYTREETNEAIEEILRGFETKTYTREETNEAIEEILRGFETDDRVNNFLDDDVTDRFNLKNKLENELPLDGPYYIRSKIKYSDGLFTAWRTSAMYKVTDDFSRDDAIDKILSIATGAFDPYADESIGDDAKVVDAEINIYDSDDYAEQDLPNVARYQVGNCLLNLFRQSGRNIDSLYEKMPHLKPNPENPTDPIYITYDDMVTSAKQLQIQVIGYSALGSKIGQKWSDFGTTKKKTIHVQFSEGHASLVASKIKISKIQYHEIDERQAYQPDVVYVNTKLVKDDDGEITQLGQRYAKQYVYYITVENMVFTMHKSFLPSSVTGDVADDSNIDFAYIQDLSQMMTRLFKTKYNITPIKDKCVKNIIKLSEHFISRRVFKELPAISLTKEVDNNAHYCSYKTNKYYQGFPTNYVPAVFLSERSKEYSHIVVNNIISAPRSFRHLMRYTTGPIVITGPVYHYLVDAGAIIDVDYALAATFRDIDILEFVGENASKRNWGSAQAKQIRNGLIGRTISGGINETKHITVNCDDHERRQLMHEADINGFSITLNDIYPSIKIDENYEINNSIKIDYHQATNGLFQFHSFVLGYAAIAMMTQWAALESAKCEILGYFVDAYLYRGDKVFDDTHPGGWANKSKPAPYFWRLTPDTEDNYSSEGRKHSERPTVLPYYPIIYTENTAYFGAAGVGKSYQHKKTPAVNAVMLTPTKALRDEHQPMIQSFTLEKYFQTSMPLARWLKLRANDSIPKGYTHIYVDECFMFNASKWDIIIERAKIDGAILIPIGDPVQICNEIGGTGVTIDWFKSKGFKIVDVARSGDLNRHDQVFGEYLDSYRSLSLQHQKIKAMRDFTQIDRETIDYDPNTRVIVGNWETAAYYNNLARNSIFPVLCKRTTKSANDTELLDPTNPRIWWDRTRMTETTPAGYCYEPIYASTVDSFQGASTDFRLYVDILSLDRHGSLYTSITRARAKKQIVLSINTKHTNLMICSGVEISLSFRPPGAQSLKDEHKPTHQETHNGRTYNVFVVNGISYKMRA